MDLASTYLYRTLITFILWQFSAANGVGETIRGNIVSLLYSCRHLSAFQAEMHLNFTSLKSSSSDDFFFLF